MAESSFPIEEKPMQSAQWGQVTLGMGSGVLSTGGDPYGITARNNGSNSITIGLGTGGLAQAVVSGFYHELDAATVVQLPAVTASTTYFVGLTYDPLKHAAATGAVSLTVSTAKPSGSGKVYLPLYEIVRNPNQLLTDATFRNRRVYVSPNLTASTQADLPPAGDMLTGTLCTTTDTGSVWRVVDGIWVPANAPWEVQPLATPGWSLDMFSRGIRVQRRQNGRLWCSLEDAYMRRTGPEFWHPSGFFSHGEIIPPGLRRPDAMTVWGAGSLTIANDVRAGAYRLNLQTGGFEFFPGNGGPFLVSVGSAIMFSASWDLPG